MQVIDFWVELLSVCWGTMLRTCYHAFQVAGLKPSIQVNKITIEICSKLVFQCSNNFSYCVSINQQTTNLKIMVIATWILVICLICIP